MISVFAPASIGNFSVGFDLLGLAIEPIDDAPLGDRIDIRPGTEFRLEVVGPHAGDLPTDDADNLVFQAHSLFCRRLGEADAQALPVHMVLHKNLPVCSGLGSSSASITAALLALNHQHDHPFSQAELLHMAAALEGRVSGSKHYDNVAPCLLGGLQLMTGLEDTPCVQVPFPEDWHLLVAHPGTQISTQQARAIVPQQLPLDRAIRFAGNLAVFIDALHQQDHDMAAEVMFDVIAEPHRKALIPGFDNFRDFARSVGATAVGISGSGPTVFAVCQDKHLAQRVHRYALRHFCQDAGFAHICQANLTGALVEDRAD